MYQLARYLAPRRSTSLTRQERASLAPEKPRNRLQYDARQVGFLMKTYRESHPRNGRRRGLTQEELLRRMAPVDGGYGERFSHTTVWRWEAGATRPTVPRLRRFAWQPIPDRREMTTILPGFTIPILTSPIPKCTPLRMDHYDFYALSDLFDTSFTYMLSLLLNLALASMSGLVFHLAHEWQCHHQP